MKKYTKSNEEKLQEKEELIKLAESSIENLLEEMKKGYSENYMSFLKISSNFYKYSLNNRMLIWLANKNATYVATFKKWQTLGYKVKAKEKAIKIFKPSIYTYIVEKGKNIPFSRMTKEQKANKKEHKISTYFSAIPVFDISQCEWVGEGEEPKLEIYDLGDDFKQNYEELKGKIESLGIKVEEGFLKNAYGYATGNNIFIEENQSYDSKFITLIHELAHEIFDFGDFKEPTTQLRELRAESISYIVCNYVGLNNETSSDYLLNYKVNEDLMKQCFELISKGSEIIINLINGEDVSSEITKYKKLTNNKEDIEQKVS